MILGYRMLPRAPDRVMCQPRQQRFLMHFCDVTARLRGEDLNTRRRCFPLSLKLDTVLKNSNHRKIQAAPTLDELSDH